MSETIRGLYRDILNRDALPNELQHWQNEFSNGASYQQVRSEIAHTAEAAADVNTLYEQVLGREADGLGLQGKESELANGQSLAQVRSEMGYSGEAAYNIAYVYEIYAGRNPSDQEITSWQDNLASGRATVADLIAQILGITDPSTYTLHYFLLQVAEDAYNGDAQYQLTIDGQQVGGAFTATASNGAGATNIVRIPILITGGQHQIGVQFINDACDRYPDLDRNLYLLSASIDGKNIPGARADLLANGTYNFSFTTETLPPPPERVGALLHDLTLTLSEDAFEGDAQFLVLVDGLQVGGPYTATASHGAGQSQSISIPVELTVGSHRIGVQFLNDAFGGTADTDRNLYLLGAAINGVPVNGASAALLSNGSFYFNVSADGSSPVSPSVVSAITNDYEQVLGREPDYDGLVHYESEYIGGTSLDQIREEIAHSDEAAADIQSAFQTIIGDAASPTDIAYWESHLGDGSVTLAGMRGQFTAAEAYAKSAPVVATLNSIYQDVLGRGIDATSLNSRQIEVARGVTLDQIRVEVANSADAGNIIQTTFNFYVGRNADADQIQELQTFLANGGTLANLPLQIHALPALSSGSLAEEAEVDELYREILGRPAEPSGIVNFEADLASGLSWASIRYDIAYSAEATQDVERLYQSILGRSATADELSSKQEDLASGSTLARTQAEIEHLPEAILRKGAASGLVLVFTEDAWMGDAKFTISVDGVQAGGVYTSGSPFMGNNQVQAVIPDAVLSVGSHTVKMTFMNDAYGGTADTDRNLYLLGAYLGGQQIPGARGTMLSTNDSVSFNINVNDGDVSAIESAAIGALYTETTGGQIDSDTISAALDALDSGLVLGDVRASFAHSSVAERAIDTVYREVLDRGATSVEITNVESSIAAGSTLTDLRIDLAHSDEARLEISDIYRDVYNRSIDVVYLSQLEDQIANGRLLLDIRPSLAFTDETRNTINQLYLDQIGRSANSDELIYWQSKLADGEVLGSVADTNGVSVAGTIAFYGLDTYDIVDDIHHQNVDLYENLAADPATDRAYGYAPDIGLLTLVGADNKTIAVADARSLLALLPVYVTMYNGQSPILRLSNGTELNFNQTVPDGNRDQTPSNAEQLAGYLLRTAQHANTHDPLLGNAYSQAMTWLYQVDQPALQAAVFFAQYSQALDAAGHANQATEARTASALALQLVSQDPSSRSASLTAKITIDGHPTLVTVYQDGSTRIHDVDDSIIAQIIDAIVTVVANALVLIPGSQTVTVPIAIAVDTANAGLALANDNVLGAVLSLAAAIAQGYGLAAFNANQAGASVLAQGYASTQQLIVAASLVVGGTYGLVNSAENGDIGGILGSALEVAGGFAAGLGPIQGINNADAAFQLGLSAKAFQNLQIGLATAGALTSFGAQVAGGHITEGLLNSLLPWLSNLAATTIANGSQVQPAPDDPTSNALKISLVESDTPVEVAGNYQILANARAVHNAAVLAEAAQYANLGVVTTTEVSFRDAVSQTPARADLVLSFGALPPTDAQLAQISVLTGVPVALLTAKAVSNAGGAPVPFLVIEVKTGLAGPSSGQQVVYPALKAGQLAIPFGPNATRAGFVVGLPTVAIPVNIERR